MNQPLAAAAIEAVTDDELDAGNPNFPRDPGVERPNMCSRFVRCTVRRVYGQRYQGLFGGSAVESGERFQVAGLARPYTDPGHLQAGDILFKMHGSGGFGHVGIYLGDGRVAENASVHSGPHGAKGYRTLAAFCRPGPPDLVVRLPAPAAARWELPNGRDGSCSVTPDGVAMVSVAELTDLLAAVGLDAMKLTDIADSLGLETSWDGQRKVVKLQRAAAP